MTRTILDDALRRWEAFATTGPYGFSDPSRVIFRCLSDPSLRSRAVTIEGDKSDAEQAVADGDDATLSEMLERATEID